MRIAEALIERADLQKRLFQLESRLCSNAKVQEGETPAEDPVKLLAELDSCTERLEALICRINLTNSNVLVDGKTLTEWIAKRDCLTKKVNTLRTFLNHASQTVIRGAKNEIVIKSTVSVSELQKNVDELSRELRETDTVIQAANWSNDLI